MTALVFALAAGAGAAARHAVNQLGWSWRGTLLVNIVGSALLGVLLASGPSTNTETVVGTGLLGSLTTFSMFAIEVDEADRQRRLLIAAATVASCVGAAAVAHTLA